MYEERAANGGNSKYVKELESELEKTKNYYNKRIREIEDKYKFGNGKRPLAASAKESNAGTEPKLQSQRSEVSEKQINDLRD